MRIPKPPGPRIPPPMNLGVAIRERNPASKAVSGPWTILEFVGHHGHGKGGVVETEGVLVNQHPEIRRRGTNDAGHPAIREPGRVRLVFVGAIQPGSVHGALRVGQRPHALAHGKIADQRGVESAPARSWRQGCVQMPY